jgi:hypothetical protein
VLDHMGQIPIDRGRGDAAALSAAIDHLQRGQCIRVSRRAPRRAVVRCATSAAPDASHALSPAPGCSASESRARSTSSASPGGHESASSSSSPRRASRRAMKAPSH